jgi:hypothetical protein
MMTAADMHHTRDNNPWALASSMPLLAPSPPVILITDIGAPLRVQARYVLNWCNRSRRSVSGDSGLYNYNGVKRYVSCRPLETKFNWQVGKRGDRLSPTNDNEMR